MKKITLVAFLLLLALFSGCEKDDICDPAQSTTPRLVIEFYDATNPAVTKAVSRLRVFAVGMPQAVVLDADATGDARYLSSGTKVSIPLKPSSNQTKLSFTYNYGGSSNVFTDSLTFNYTRREIYVSRACGYKVNYLLNNDTADLPPILVNGSTIYDGTNWQWIRDFSIVQPNIETENETHLRIYF